MHDEPILFAALDKNFLLMLAQELDLDAHFAISAVLEEHPVKVLDPCQYGLM
jgi:hypothetical protein